MRRSLAWVSILQSKVRERVHAMGPGLREQQGPNHSNSKGVGARVWGAIDIVVLVNVSGRVKIRSCTRRGCHALLGDLA